LTVDWTHCGADLNKAKQQPNTVSTNTRSSAQRTPPFPAHHRRETAVEWTRRCQRHEVCSCDARSRSSLTLASTRPSDRAPVDSTASVRVAVPCARCRSLRWIVAAQETHRRAQR
jgi:hypothetical protein